MKPRFSILTLLGVIAYAAVVIAAATRPGSVWIRGSQMAWLGALMLLVAFAVQLTQRSRVTFARAALVCTFLYLLVTRSPIMSPTPDDGIAVWITNQLEFPDPPNSTYTLREIDLGNLTREQQDFFEELVRASGRLRPGSGDRVLAHDVAMIQLVTQQAALIFGLLGGALAFWRYRVLECREQQRKSD